jgi:hypothetical protein
MGKDGCATGARGDGRAARDHRYRKRRDHAGCPTSVPADRRDGGDPLKRLSAHWIDLVIAVISIVQGLAFNFLVET